MKKTLKVISIFFSLALFFLTVNLIGNENIIRGEPHICDNNNADCTYSYGQNKVTIGKGGQITVKYSYGYTELLVDINDGKEIIHMSGEKGSGEKTLHLSNYLAVGKTYNIRLVIEFASSNTQNFIPLYCNETMGTEGCADSAEYFHISTKNDRSVYMRVEKYKTGAEPIMVDNRQVVYFNNPGCSSRNKCYIEDYTNKESFMYKGELLVEKTGGDADAQAVEEEITDTIIPLLLSILGVAAITTTVTLGYKIVKSADEPQERREYIAKLRNILIGIGIAFLLVALYTPVTELVSTWLEE